MKRVLGFVCFALGFALLALFMVGPWGRQSAKAHEDPPGCAARGEAFAAVLFMFRDDGDKVFEPAEDEPLSDGFVVTHGDQLWFVVGANNPQSAGLPRCTAFDVDVNFNFGGGTSPLDWDFICNLTTVPSDGFDHLCNDDTAPPEAAGPYLVTKDVVDADGNLVVRADARGNDHGGTTDCVLTTAQRGPKALPSCRQGSATGLLFQPSETPTATPTATATPTTTVTPVKPPIKKVPNLRNLWLCNVPSAPGCDNKASGVEEVNFNVEMNAGIGALDPKCLAQATPPPGGCPRQSIGSFEFEVRYPSKYVSVTVEPGILLRDDRVNCATTRLESSLQFRCVTKGKTRVVYGPGTLAIVHVRPTPDDYSILIANQLNGIMVQLINQDCQLSDLQGHPIKTDVCGDASVTIRYLEGDVHADCFIDVHDQQQIAFRWGSRLGSLLYNDRFDLEPSLPKKRDGDVDAKDLQLVYGRHGSTCKAPHPPQPPVDPKAKIEPPTATPTATSTPD